MKIHPTAIVGPRAELSADCEIGPYSIVEDGAVLGPGNVLEAGAIVRSGVTLGADNRVGPGAVLGGAPQHARAPERTGRLIIGSRNVIREHVTINRALEEPSATTLGDDCLLMIGVHVGHDCRVGNRVICANNALLGGHVTVDDRAFISGAAAFHQFTRVGRLAMVGGQAHITRDVPPYVTIDGASSFVVGLNSVGIRRAGLESADVQQLKRAYQLIYRSGLPWSEILARLEQDFATGPAADFHPFLVASRRGCTPARVPARATIRFAAPEEGAEPASRPAALRLRRAA